MRPGARGFHSMVRVEVSGLREVRESLGRLGKIGARAAKAVILEKTQRIAARAKPETPDDPATGERHLADSVRAIRPSASRTGKVTGGVMAGGKALEVLVGNRRYSAIALVQHEDLTLKHARGGPKFLERPFLAEVPSIPGAILDALDRLADAEQ